MIESRQTKFKTLHEAIDFILDENGNKFMTFGEISGQIKKQHLWKRKKDNDYPSPFQIRLRAVVQKHYKGDYFFQMPNKIRKM